MTRFGVYIDQQSVSFAQTKVRKLFVSALIGPVDLRSDQRQSGLAVAKGGQSRVQAGPSLALSPVALPPLVCTSFAGARGCSAESAGKSQLSQLSDLVHRLPCK